MPVVVRDELKNLERELGNQAAALVRLIQTRALADATEGAKPGQAWPDPKAMGVTCGSESEIQLACEKIKAVLSVIKKTKTATGPEARGDRGSHNTLPAAQTVPKAMP